MASSRALILTRAFSVSSASRQLIKAPVQVFGIEGRYATALYSAATKEKKLDVVEKELLEIHKQFQADPKFREWILDPSMKRSLKAQALAKVSEAMKFSSCSSNLLTLLAENGRLKKMNGVIKSFKLLMAAHRGEVACHVATAKAMDEPTKKELEAALKAFLKKGETLLLTTSVEPEILGGMVVSIGDRYVDMSTATKVKKMTEVISVAI